ncbi:MAG: hypothetical protein LBT80_03910 [Lactobacillaceae bacterium]|jgi:hypothetical protein|nr:hypothetical protein [Lactobacillaceae bacterium]
MQITGNDLIAAVKAESIVKQQWTAADQATINLDAMFDFLTDQLKQAQLVSVDTIISGDEPIHLAIETNLVNLPLRYASQLGKILINDPANEVNLYMFVEHPLVTHSGLRIELAASVAAYLDDEDSVKTKIAAFFDKEIATINQNLEAMEISAKS